ncbi:efflux RND transporter periplasmic adaptor subunit [Sphingomonas sabuli]|uniref:Efflux RND transporter periplasmic adaptor subunit n=2 Tax=Sphingomonas sabuli TaxID=2764186 RepID=A0A7G9L602_9SPHN|nr:efflux RND transporter periplasmic adaptor subunit [Sphingomonas sabuli]QNM84051.1 efflux RND transporter periplasmic adaptor subunit [Sphingomonas sabuli]
MNLERPLRTTESDTLVVIDDGARRRKRMAIIAAALVAVIAIIVAMMMLGGGKPAADEGATAGKIPTVSVIVPGQTSVARVITASGALAARRDQPVGVAGQGGRVTQVLVDAGSWARQGQTLAVIDRSVQTQQAAQLAAQIDAAQANAALAEANYQRALSLQGRGFVSKAEIDSKRATRDAATAQVRVARAQLGATRAEIGRLNITAPSAGLVLERNVEVGQVVGAGAGALFRMAQGGAMEIRANLPQQDLTAVKVGMPATVTPLGSDRTFTGSVWQVAPTIDPQTRQGEVRISVPYDPAFKPGGFGEAKITANQTTAPVLPQSAVMSDSKGSYVFIVGSNNKIERRAVQLGEVQDAGVTVIGGLSGRERVVETAGPFLNPGQEVRPKRVVPKTLQP